MAAIKIFISSVQKEFSEERKALVRFLEEKEYLRLLPWDATMSNDATIADLDEKKISDFVALARTKRGFKLDYTGDNTLDILIALNLATEAGRITNAALLLFAKNPQRYFVSSVVKCMVFPTDIMTKPILSHQVYQGTLPYGMTTAWRFGVHNKKGSR